MLAPLVVRVAARATNSGHARSRAPPARFEDAGGTAAAEAAADAKTSRPAYLPPLPGPPRMGPAGPAPAGIAARPPAEIAGRASAGTAELRPVSGAGPPNRRAGAEAAPGDAGSSGAGAVVLPEERIVATSPGASADPDIDGTAEAAADRSDRNDPRDARSSQPGADATSPPGHAARRTGTPRVGARGAHGRGGASRGAGHGASHGTRQALHAARKGGESAGGEPTRQDATAIVVPPAEESGRAALPRQPLGVQPFAVPFDAPLTLDVVPEPASPVGRTHPAMPPAATDATAARRGARTSAPASPAAAPPSAKTAGSAAVTPVPASPAPAAPEPDAARYKDIFGQAVAAAARLHASLAEDVTRAVDAVRQAADTRAGRRQAGLDRDLETLDRALESAMEVLRGASDSALLALAGHAGGARTAIQSAAANAMARIGGTRAMAAAPVEGDGSAEQQHRQTVLSTGTAAAGAIGTAGEQAAKALGNLAAKPEQRFGRSSDSMESARNERIALRIRPRASQQQVTMQETAEAQKASVARYVAALDGQLKQAIETYRGLLRPLDTDAPAAVTRARHAAEDQVGALSRSMSAAIRTGRAQTEAALVRQKNSARADLIGNATAAAKAEQAEAEARANADARAASGLAMAPAASVRAVLDTLRARRHLPEADFARVAIASSRALPERMTASTDPALARQRAAAGAAVAELLRRGAATDGRLEQSTASAAAGLIRMATGGGDALRVQADSAAVPMTQTAAAVARAPDAAISSVAGTFKAKLDTLKSEIDDAGGDLTNALDGKPPKKPGPTKTGESPTPGPRETANVFKKRASGIAGAPETEGEIAPWVEQARGAVREDIYARGNGITEELKAIFHSEENILSNLRGMLPRQAHALDDLYSNQLGPAIDHYFSTTVSWSKEDNKAAALSYLHGDAKGGAINELKSATSVWNESARIDRVMRSLPAKDLSEMGSTDKTALDAIQKELDGVDRAVFEDLRKGTPEGLASANARRLGVAIDEAKQNYGATGTAKTYDAIRDAARAAGGDVQSGADGLHKLDGGTDDLRTGEERKATQENIWNKTVEAFANQHPMAASKGTGAMPGADAKTPGQAAQDALIDYATKGRDMTIAPSSDPAMQKWAAAQQRRQDIQKALIGALVRTGEGSAETRGALFAEQMSRGWIDRKRLDEATYDPDLNPELNSRDPLRFEKQKKAIERQERALRIADQHLHGTSGEAAVPPGNTKQDGIDSVRGRLNDDIGKQTYDPLLRRYLQSMIVDSSKSEGRTEQAQAGLAYGLDRSNADVTRQVFDRRTRGQIDREVYDPWNASKDGVAPGATKWSALDAKLGIHGKGTWSGSVFSGEEAQKVEASSLGAAQTDLQKAEVAALIARQQIKGAGKFGQSVAPEEHKQMVQRYKDLLAVMGVDDPRTLEADPTRLPTFDDRGRLRVDEEGKKSAPVGNFDEHGDIKLPAGMKPGALDFAIGMSGMSARNYTAATDRVANAIATALVITAAIVTTALTGGAAASIWIPVLVTAAAGAAGIAANRLIKGERYGRDEIAHDVAVAVVQTITAGIGAGIAARAAKAAQAAKLAGTVAESAGAAAAKGGLTLAQRAMKLGTDAAVAGGLNAAGAMGQAALDRNAWHEGGWGGGIWHAGWTGFLGGALGSVVMAPVMKNASASDGLLLSMGRRGLGVALSGTTTRAVDLAAGDRDGHRVTMNEAVDELGLAFLQNYIQGAGEGAGEVAHHRVQAAREARRAAGEAAAARTSGEASHEPAARVPEHPAVPPALREMAPEAARAMETTIPQEKIAGTGGIAPAQEANRRLPAMSEAAGHPAGEPPPPIARSPAAAEEPGPQRRPVPAVEDPAARSTQPPVDDEAITQRHPGIQGDAETAGRPHPSQQPEPGWLAEQKHLPPGSVVIDPDPKNPRKALDDYRQRIRESPNREVAIYRNTETGQLVVVQGDERSAFVAILKSGEHEAPMPGGRKQGWKAVLLGQDVGDWQLVSHFHPARDGGDTAGMSRRLPSGKGGDLSVVEHESRAAGGAPRRSRIDYLANGEFHHTDFGYDRSLHGGPYWVEFEHPVTGIREKIPFTTPQAYHAFFEDVTGRPLREIGQARPGAAEPARPAAAPRDDDYVFFHGTTAEGQETMEREGVIAKRNKGEGEDFSAAFYATPQEAVGQSYAATRSKDGTIDEPRVLAFRVSKQDMGVVVDIRKGGEFRAAFEAFMAGPSPFADPRFPAFRTLPQTVGEYIVSAYGGHDERGVYFEKFLESINRSHADAIHGDLGGTGTAGIGSDVPGAEQIAIRSQRLADLLSEQLPGRRTIVPDLPEVPHAAAPEPESRAQVEPALTEAGRTGSGGPFEPPPASSLDLGPSAHDEDLRDLKALHALQDEAKKSLWESVAGGTEAEQEQAWESHEAAVRKMDRLLVAMGMVPAEGGVVSLMGVDRQRRISANPMLPPELTRVLGEALSAAIGRRLTLAPGGEIERRLASGDRSLSRDEYELASRKDRMLRQLGADLAAARTAMPDAASQLPEELLVTAGQTLAHAGAPEHPVAFIVRVPVETTPASGEAPVRGTAMAEGEPAVAASIPKSREDSAEGPRLGDHPDPVAGFVHAQRREQELVRMLAKADASERSIAGDLEGKSDALRGALDRLAAVNPGYRDLADLDLSDPASMERIKAKVNDPARPAPLEGKPDMLRALVADYEAARQRYAERQPDIRAQADRLRGQIDTTREDLTTLRRRLDTEVRPMAGVPLSTLLPDPVAGWDYEPVHLEGGTTENELSHLRGFQAELRLANDIVINRGELVVSYGDKIGRHGADVVSVDPVTGEVTLWDSKYRGSGAIEAQSGTFSGERLQSALDEADEDLRRTTNLPASVRDRARANLRIGKFRVATVSSTEPTSTSAYPITGEEHAEFRGGQEVK